MSSNQPEADVGLLRDVEKAQNATNSDHEKYKTLLLGKFQTHELVASRPVRVKNELRACLLMWA